MIKALIVENEMDKAEMLESMLHNLFSDIAILEICDTVKSSLSAIKKHSPDLVFLDVKLNNGETGFEILERAEKIDFEIIFTTAYDQYAKQAFRVSALDFLEKPIDKEQLNEAIEKFKQKKFSLLYPKQIELAIAAFNNPMHQLTKVAIPTMEGLVLIEVMDIIFCEGESSQSILYLSENKKLVVNSTLKECGDILQSSNFFRIHKSFLINLDKIQKYTKGKDGEVLMSNGVKLVVSRTYKDEFIKKLRKL